MVNPRDVTAIIVTRGDVDLDLIVDALYEATGNLVQVWDNKFEDDLAVYGRYAAIERTTSPVIYVQDDDCILPPESIAALLAAYQTGHVVCNMPKRFREHYPDSALVGFGAVFDRDLPRVAFLRYGCRDEDLEPPTWFKHDDTGVFRRTCDVVFTTLTPRILVDVPVQILDYAYGDDRMYRQPGHVGERARMLELARRVRDAVPA